VDRKYIITQCNDFFLILFPAQRSSYKQYPTNKKLVRKITTFSSAFPSMALAGKWNNNFPEKLSEK
jgi:hypothetical protein